VSERDKLDRVCSDSNPPKLDRIAVSLSDLGGLESEQTRTRDKHDTPPSHFKLTLGQPALLHS